MRAANILSIGLGLFISTAAIGQIELLDSFNPTEGGSINAIGFNRDTDEIFVHFEHNSMVHVYDRAGTFLREIPKPSGIGGNDGDLEFADVEVNIGGTAVPAFSLLEIENDVDPPRIVAGDPVTGAVLAQQNFDGTLFGTWTGGAYHHDRGTFFCCDWRSDTIQEVDASNGTVLNSFTINPAGAPGGFDLFYSDVDILRGDGMLYLVSDSQDFMRVLTPTGGWVGDIDLSAIGVTDMSGIAFDDERGEAWFSGQASGTIFRVGGFVAFPLDPCSDADLTFPFGTLDFFDVQTFLGLFSSGDLAADFNNDSVLDFFDVQIFLGLFSAGCP